MPSFSLRLLLVLLIALHGLIHLTGFAKAFEYAEIGHLKQEISRPAGLAWLLCALLLAAAGVLFILRQTSWWWVALPALVVSQALIFTFWNDAKFGTIANLVILLPVLAAAAAALPGSYGNRFSAAVGEGLERQAQAPIVSEADLCHLPAPVQKYLRFAGVVGRPRIRNFRAVFSGQFRNGIKSPWMDFRSEQYNFYDPPARLFLMRASLYGLPVEGLHLFRGDGATMQIKVASLVPVVDAKGPSMNQGETVTLFNDLCLLAPAALIDRENIRWETVGPLEARARFTNRGVTISATLFFNEAGALTDFTSNDRFLSSDGTTYLSHPWSTPVHGYKDLGGRRVVSNADAMWHMPESPFVYGTFNLDEIGYNLEPGSEPGRLAK
jgi:hypothetical protein